MAIFQVAKLGQQVLRQLAKKVEKEEIKTPEFQTFIDSLLESMHFHKGVGLAAPQVFVSKRIVAIWVPTEMDENEKGITATVFINPELNDFSEEIEDGWEGCLSLKGLRGVVPRHQALTLEALDRLGKKVTMKLSGFTARVLQHEVDHLDGKVFVDRMRDMSTLGFEDDISAEYEDQAD